MNSLIGYGKLTRAICGVLALGALFSGPPAVADRFTDQVKAQLIGGAMTILGEGYRLSHEPYMSILGGRMTQMIEYRLESGKSYAFLGVCDEDCGDLDLSLYDANNKVVDYDAQIDDFPLVQAYVLRDSVFRVKVTMSNCSNVCAYGVGVFEK